jgi:5'-nucleotidase (lipoprotein e(P4) family)
VKTKILARFKTVLHRKCFSRFFAAVLVLALSGLTFEAYGAERGNILTVAVAWKQTSAEYRALYHQGFNIAAQKVRSALAARGRNEKPLAVLTDLDDTLVLPLKYWGTLIERGLDFFDDALWDGWIAEYEMTPAPGALDFLKFCEANGVEVFYVTNRDQGGDTYKLALESIRLLGFPYADKEHLTVQIDTSNKEAPQKAVAEKYNVVCYLGDNLNDFKRAYYVKDVSERIALMEADKDLFGDKFVLFPNPTDGHWIRAIFGESEPPANDANRKKFEEAAMANSSK